ncbi:MAG: hypothetical protein GC155_02030 [Alphaproteobacteria bacterium]|nr:hypothetical protein [Alphaproteobacteria bacterium]
MAEDPRLTPADYLDRFFDELRLEVRSNPKLAARLVKALGGNVVFADEAKADVANPYALAASGSKSRFYSVFATMKPSQVKRVMRENNLATSVDMAGKNVSQLIDMMFERATSKVSERRSSVF